MPLSFFSPPKPRGNNTNKSMRKRKWAGDYWLGKTLGKGSSGRVKLGYHKITGEKVAVKIISKAYLTSNASSEKSVRREIAIMKLIQHPHIVRLIDVIDVEGSPNLYLILEYVQGGELFDHLITKGRLSEKGARKYFHQIIQALDFCHKNLICHRDLKPENLLLDDAFNIKIADFGMASLQPSGTLLETSCGSPHYASPEIVTGIPYNGSASDIWSCGVILYALLCGHLPFDDNNIRELLHKVKRGKYSLPSFLSDLAKDLIRKILVVRPDKRLTMQQIQDHEWFKMDGFSLNTTNPPHGIDSIPMRIQNPSSIDERLLETLKSLWAGQSHEQLMDALMSKVYNMEKVAYHLLQQHSTKYWQTKNDDQEPTADSTHGGKRSPRRPNSICASDLPSCTKSILPRRPGNEIHDLIPPPSPDIQRSCFSRKHPMDPSLRPVPIALQKESSSLRSATQDEPSPNNSSLIGKSRNGSLLAVHQQSHTPKVEDMKQLMQEHEMATQQPSPGQSRLHSLLRRMDLHGGSSNTLSPTPTTRKTHRLSIPLPAKPLINNAISNRHTLYPLDQALPIQTCHIEARPSHPLMCHGSPWLASKARVAPSSPRLKAPTLDSPKLSSWLPGLSHFKRPKIHIIHCSAKDSKEAFGKVAQVIREQLNGSYSEREIHGLRQGYATIDILCDQGPSQKVRFRLERDALVNQQKRININLIQQQGDTTAFTSAVELVEKMLDEYERDAEFVSTANGWNL